MRVLDDGRIKFSATADGQRRYLILDPAQRERIVKTDREVASANPVVRVFKFRKKDEKKDEVPAKPEANALDAKPKRLNPWPIARSSFRSFGRIDA